MVTNPKTRGHKTFGGYLIRIRYSAFALLSGCLLSLSFGNACVVADEISAASDVGSIAATNQNADSLTSSSWAWFRQKISTNEAKQRYGVRLDQNNQALPTQTPLVLVVHGLNSAPEHCESLLTEVRAAGVPCGVFAYPNDQAIADSAALLASELRQLTVRSPGCRVALVTHSMGGLVARGCVENPGIDPGNVNRLIMVAPPTHGSKLASYAFATDLWEHWYCRKKGGPWRRTRDGIIDGLGEAVGDLCADSTYLRQLNSRPRNPAIKYTVILGTAGPVSESQLKWTVEKLQDKTKYLPGVHSLAKQTAQELGNLTEVVEGQGDGVVAIERGKLAGVDDLVLLPFGHLSIVEAAGALTEISDELTDNSRQAATQQVRRLILQRIVSQE